MADNDSRDGTPRGLAKSEQISEKNYPPGDCDASTPMTVFSGVHPVTVDEIGKDATVSLYFSSPTWSVVQPAFKVHSSPPWLFFAPQIG